MNNVLIMAMSTRKPGKKVFYYESEDYVDGNSAFFCKGESPLEPIPKYMSWKLGEVSKIIVLCTDDTLNAINHEDGLSAYEFFRKRIEEAKTNDKYVGLRNVLIESIALDENHPEAGIRNLVANIRSEESIENLWIDTHGGFRDMSLIYCSILRLLENYKIKVNEIYGIRHTELNSQDNRSKIISQKQNYAFVDFVSGMSEFTNYGLMGAFEKYYKEKQERSEQALKVKEAMTTVSNGILVCDPDGYIQGIGALNKALEGFEEDTSYLSIFKDFFKSDFGELANAVSESSHVLALIERCMNRNMLQQALTFVEASMVKEVYDKGLITVNNVTLKFKNGKNLMILNLLPEEYLEEHKWGEYKYLLKKIRANNDEDLRGSFFNKYLWYNTKEVKQRDVMEGKYIKCEIDNPAEIGEKDNVIGTLNFNINIPSRGTRQDLKLFLSLHKILKEQRNIFNHAKSASSVHNKKRLSANKIKSLLEKYIEVGRKLGLD